MTQRPAGQRRGRVRGGASAIPSPCPQSRKGSGAPSGGHADHRLRPVPGGEGWPCAGRGREAWSEERAHRWEEGGGRGLGVCPVAMAPPCCSCRVRPGLGMTTSQKLWPHPGPAPGLAAGMRAPNRDPTLRPHFLGKEGRQGPLPGVQPGGRAVPSLGPALALPWLCRLKGEKSL